MNFKQPGFILFITFSILALCTALVSAFLVKGMVHKRVVQVIIDQEQLASLALSTPAIVQSFLYAPSDKKLKSEKNKEQQEALSAGGQEKSSDSYEKSLLQKILPVVNIEQKFNLKSIDPDLPFQVSLTFFAESGKININALYDLIHKKFFDEDVVDKSSSSTAVKDCKAFTTWLFDRIAVLLEKPSLLTSFIEHVKARKIPFNDVTELLNIKEFADCFADAVYYEPCNQQKKIFLTDVFTVASESDTLQPWLFSPSVCALLNIKKGQKNENSDRKNTQEYDLSSYKKTTNWEKDWNTAITQLYEVSYDKIPEKVRSFLATEFRATVFSVIVQVTYEQGEHKTKNSVKIFALLKEKKLPDGSMMYEIIKNYQL
jgi:hypothetical protein